MAGGITLYRTFALYEEKKEFNVLRGRVPDFRNYDIHILAITVNGETSSTIPEPGNYNVNVECIQGQGHWDYNNWNAVIKEINNQTKCNLTFESKTEEDLLWRKWIQKGEVTKYYTTLHSFLSDNEAVTQVFNSAEASTYLKENASIVDLIKEDSNYLPNALPEVGENEDSRSELVKIILNSTGLTNKEKYDVKLPFYVFKDGNSFLTFNNYNYTAYVGGGVFDGRYDSDIYLYMQHIPTRCGVNAFRTTEKINYTNYDMLSIRFKATRTTTSQGLKLGFTSKTATNEILPEIIVVSHNMINDNNTGWYSANISSLNGNEFVDISINFCGTGTNSETATFNLYEWYMY